VAFYWLKKNKKWIIKAVDRGKRQTVAWVIGGRDASTFRRLYDKVRHLKDCIFYTDNWDAFAKVLPHDRHVIGKAHTTTIEQDNSNTRHHLGRMTRRTKVVSKKEDMIHASMKLWCSLTDPTVFKTYQETFLSIFR
jgi:insertion element IS1 protein InsB